MFKKIVSKFISLKMYKCRDCGEYFSTPSKEVFAINMQQVPVCPICKSPKISGR